MRNGMVATIFAALLLPNALDARRGYADTAIPKKHIVLFYTHRDLTPINADWDRGIRQGLAEGHPEGVKIDIEYLDLARYDDDEYSQRWSDLLRLKYAKQPIDLVMPVYAHALRFTLGHRKALFPGVPVVFCSSPHLLSERARAEPGVTGVAFQLDFKETTKVARRLFPKARRLYLLSGSSEHDRVFQSMAHQALVDFQESLTIIDVDGLPLPQLLDEMARIESDSILLMLSYEQDTLGNDYFTGEVVEQLSPVCPAPIFSLYDSLLGRGIVGGQLASAELQGQLAGRMAGRVLHGEDPAAIPVIGLETNRLMFDARELRRWGISKTKLPSGSLVQYQEETSWDRYRVHILVGLMLLSLQSLVILGLVVNRSRRVRAEQSLVDSRSEASRLAGRLLSAQEDERKRIARELHDDLSQRLAASAIEAGKLERRFTDSPGSRDVLAQLKDDLISLSDDLHRISRQIHPAILEDLGLKDALRSECDRMSDRDGTSVRLRCGGVPRDLPKDISLCLYRVAQEALWNAARHSATDSIDVLLSADPEGVHLEVRDFGCGLEPGEVAAKAGLGLASMKERARLVGGQLVINSVRGVGTTVTVSIPLLEENR